MRLAAAALLLLTIPTASAVAADEPRPPLLVFVGEQMALGDLGDGCGDNPDCLSYTRYYGARYRVLDVVHGVAPSEEIEFEVAAHSGAGEWSYARRALLFVRLASEGPYWLERSQGYAMYPTADGDWATCGGLYKVVDPAPEPIEFSPPLVVDDTSRLTPIGIAGQWDPQIYSVVDGEVVCRRGIRLADVVAHVDREALDDVELDAVPPAAVRRARGPETAPPPPEPAKPRLVSFVGEQLSIVKRACPAPGDDDGKNCRNRYLARYRVVEPLSGDVSGVVEFEAAQFPLSDYAFSRWAVLHVGMSPSRTWLVGEISLAVYPTVEGSWAACAPWLGYHDYLDRLEPVRLAGDPSFGDVRWMSARGIAQLFPPETYEIVDGRARCRRGFGLPALVAVLESKLASGRKGNGWVEDEFAPPDP